MEIKYNVFTTNHWESCIQCSILAFEEDYEQTNERIHQIMGSKYSRGFVALDGKKVVGMMIGQIRTLNGRQLVIEDFCVLPEYQRQKIGTELLEFAQKELKTENVDNFSLTVVEGRPAVKFYEQNGFVLDKADLFMSKSF